ncbi:hypothetical protein CN491_24080 [Bacillus cereus]|uniref:Uncharacterized protein n=2 Tax=Bacillus TaxID=1386 RepID=A0A2A8LI31_BACCE|nr:hypothetical protein CN491_24080 [Bacillus cereus]PFP70149.1 hypothetical protein COJ95_24930 [Bacillus cereus]
MSKKVLNRSNNNSFVVIVTPITDSSDLYINTEKKMQTPKKKKFNNQQNSIKISSYSKEKLEALIKLTNAKYAHEITDLLIKGYGENELTSEQKRKLELFYNVSF